MSMSRIEEQVKYIHGHLSAGNRLPIVESIKGSSAGANVLFDGGRFLNFSVNGYLGLADHPRVKEAQSAAALRCGAGGGASRFTGGTNELHLELENAIARLKDPSGTKTAVIFSAGYLANIGPIPALTFPPLLSEVEDHLPETKQDWGDAAIFIDETDHNCIIAGAILADGWSRFMTRQQKGVEIIRFRHNLPISLERKIKANKAARKLIVVDGVFSLNGHIAPLAEYARIAKEYGAMLYTDDAHATGVLGENGRGSAEFCGVEGKVDIQMGTFSKALGGQGGFIVANPEIVEYLRYSSGSYLFQTALAPSIVAGLIEAIKIVQSDEGRELRNKLWRNVAYVKDLLEQKGYDLMGTQTQIMPILIGDERKAKLVAEELKKRHVYAPCYYSKAVMPNKAIIRANIMAIHTESDLDYFVEALDESVEVMNQTL